MKSVGHLWAWGQNSHEGLFSVVDRCAADCFDPGACTGPCALRLMNFCDRLLPWMCAKSGGQKRREPLAPDQGSRIAKMML